MDKLLPALLTLVVLLFVLPTAYGQEAEPPAGQPSTTEAPPADTAGAKAEGGEFVVTVEEVAGTVEIQSGGQGNWVPAVAGMRFGEGTSVCTGFKSGAILEFGDSSVVMLKDLAQVTVDRLFKDANAVEGTLSLTVGRVAVYVKKQEIRTEFRVSTPKLTAAVKGSFLEMENSPDLGVLIMTALGDVGIVNEFNAERPIGERVSPQRERAILRNRLMLWRAELGRRVMHTDFGGRFIRQFADEIRPGEAPRPGALDGMQGMNAPQRLPIGALARGIDGGLRFPVGTGPGGALNRFTGAQTANRAMQSGLPPLSGSRLWAQVDRLAVMDNMNYGNLACYLRHDGSVGPAVIDAVQFKIAHHDHPRRMRWLSALIDGSPHGRTLRDAIANPP